MKVFDFHTHIFPDSLAERALSALAYGAHVRPLTNGTLSGTAEYMKKEGVNNGFLVCNIATNAKQQQNVNDFAFFVQASAIAESFGSVYPGETAVTELERIVAGGLKGIKLHPEYQAFDADDKIAYPIYEFCQDKKLCIVMHAGIDAAYPTTLRAGVPAINRVVKDFPRLKLVAAHFGGWMKSQEVLQNLAPAENLYLDTSCAVGFISPEVAEAIIKKQGAEKVVFGSDCPWGSPSAHIRFIDGMNLTGQEKELIFYGNAKRLLNLK